jgi:hypothetical protein
VLAFSSIIEGAAFAAADVGSLVGFGAICRRQPPFDRAVATPSLVTR